MGFSLESAGAGAGEGLDTFLQRLLVEQEVNQRGQAQQETGRHNKAEEALSGRNLDQNDALRQSLEGERAQTVADRQRLAAEEGARKTSEDALYNDPNTDPTIKKFLGLRRVVPKGENIPIEVLGLQKAGAEKSLEKVTIDLPGVGNSLPAMQHPLTGAIMYGGQDVTQKNGKPWAIVHHEPAMSFLPTDNGILRAPKGGGAATPVTDTAGNVVMPKESGQIANRRDLATTVGEAIPEARQDLDEAERMGLLGPLQGRLMNEFLAGKVGSTGNDQADELLGHLRMNLSAIRTGFAAMHGRGGANLGNAAEVEKQMDATHMSRAELKGALDSMATWVGRYAKRRGATSSATPPAGSETDPLGLGLK